MKADLRLVGFTAGIWSADLVCLHHGAAVGGWFALVGTLATGLLGVLLPRSRGHDRGWRRLLPAGYQPGMWAAIGLSLLAGGVCGAAVTSARVVHSRHSGGTGAGAGAGPGHRRTHGHRRPPSARRVGQPAGVPGTSPHPRLDTDAGRITVGVACSCWPRTGPGRACCRVPRPGPGRLSPSRGGDLTAAVLAPAASPSRWGRAVDASGRPARCGPGCAGLPAAARRSRRAAAGTGRRRHQPAGSGRGRRLPGHRHDPPGRRLRRQPGDRGRPGAGPGAVVPGRAAAQRALLCALSLAGFVILARPSPSVLRAAAMGAIGLLALAWAGARAAVPALAAAIGGAAAGRPGAGRRRRASRCRCRPPPGCCCSRRGGGMRCAAREYRPGWPRRWRYRPPPRWPARR